MRALTQGEAGSESSPPRRATTPKRVALSAALLGIVAVLVRPVMTAPIEVDAVGQHGARRCPPTPMAALPVGRALSNS